MPPPLSPPPDDMRVIVSTVADGHGEKNKTGLTYAALVAYNSIKYVLAEVF